MASLMGMSTQPRNMQPLVSVSPSADVDVASAVPVVVVPDVVPVNVLELDVVVVVVEVADVAEGSHEPPRSRQAVRLSPRLTRSALSRANTR